MYGSNDLEYANCVIFYNKYILIAHNTTTSILQTIPLCDNKHYPMSGILYTLGIGSVGY